MIALDLESECKSPLDLRGATQLVSCCLDFTYRQNVVESLDCNSSESMVLTYCQWARLRALFVLSF